MEDPFEDSPASVVAETFAVASRVEDEVDLSLLVDAITPHEAIVVSLTASLLTKGEVLLKFSKLGGAELPTIDGFTLRKVPSEEVPEDVKDQVVDVSRTKPTPATTAAPQPVAEKPQPASTAGLLPPFANELRKIHRLKSLPKDDLFSFFKNLKRDAFILAGLVAVNVVLGLSF